MNEFSAKLSETTSEIILEIFGAIDAGAKFPTMQIKSKNLVIKFQNVTLMNSYGIKVWCKWAAELKDLPMIFLDECPFVFAKNFSSIRGFLTPNMKVRSFYVPFYSDASHETKNVLMTLNKDFTDDGLLNIPKTFDSKGAEMELDVDKRSYFQFLKKS
jgi:hypothetical protein